ncbi:MAG TPA: 30S ribosomal protein S20 [bacterium]|nr:30S ribosomal protein S20 [bacterium]
MPITQSVKKRVRQAEKRRTHNKHYKSQMRGMVKKMLNTTSKDDAEEMYSQIVSVIDKVASKGIIHKNKAAREKRKITRHLNDLS